MTKKGGLKKDINLDSFVEGIGLLVLELGRHPESSSILTFDQETLLTLLAHSGKTSLKDIKTNLNINTFQVSRLLSSSENYVEGKSKVSLIVRQVNRDDKRQWDISLSDDGRRVLKEELHRRRLRVKKLLDPLTPEDKASFMSIIQKMLAEMRRA
jgi:DNA-binding MarR family transcriptional regulator